MIDVSNQNPLISRAFMALEDGEWFAANKYCEEALNQEPENAYAYLGKLLAKLYCHNTRELLERETPLTGDPFFEKILCFGSQDLRDKLNWIDQGIEARIEEKRRVRAQEEEEQRIQEEETKKRVIRWLKRLAPIVAVLIFVTQLLMPFLRYPSIERAKVGEYVRFGKYQDETMTWRVLDVQENKKLLITEFGIDCQKYDYLIRDNITWEKCTLRTWLNYSFYNKSFSEEEKNRIVGTTLENKYNPQNGTGGGNNTLDKIFCLSIEETQKYFKNQNDRCCLPTKFALENDAFTASKALKGMGIELREGTFMDSCNWWLRSAKAYVNVIGDIWVDSYVGSSTTTVRPALWVKVKS